MTRENPSVNRVKRRKCFLCGYSYEETYGFSFSGEFICGDCLLKIPMKELPKIIMRKRREEDERSS